MCLVVWLDIGHAHLCQIPSRQAETRSQAGKSGRCPSKLGLCYFLNLDQVLAMGQDLASGSFQTSK